MMCRRVLIWAKCWARLRSRTIDRQVNNSRARARPATWRLVAHRQGGIEQQDPSACPRFEAPVVGNRQAQIVVQLLMDVSERSWHRRVARDGEGQTVRLAGTVVRILADDHYFRLGAVR